jgi:hypothetical protein
VLRVYAGSLMTITPRGTTPSLMGNCTMRDAKQCDA